MDPRVLRPNPLSLALILALSAHAGTRHDFERPVFVFTFHPDVPVTRFAAGEIGIPAPSYARIYLFPAYRYLEGKPLSSAEQQRWRNVWNLRTRNDPPAPNASQVWIDARKRLPIPFHLERLQPAELQQRAYVYTGPCQDDAFLTAARTLDARARRFGPGSAEMKFWVEGQDAVFEACATAAPQKLASTQNPLLRADRDYQIAAAALYAQQFDRAAALFHKIAADNTSPWRVWAPYQAGRALLYKARQTQSETVYRTALLAAQNQFYAIIHNPALRESHQAAEYLYVRCLLITNHTAALQRIGRRLLRGDWAETDLILYLNGMDETPQRPADPLTQWIVAFQKGVPLPAPASPAAVYSTLWHRKSAPAAQIEAARTSGIPALGFLAARHLARQGQFDQARQTLAPVLQAFEALPSARNRALQLHALLAPTWDEFLARAPRRPILGSRELDPDEWTSSETTDPATARRLERDLGKKELARYLLARKRSSELGSQTHWDEAAVAVLARHAPLTILLSAANHSSLPGHLRDELALVVFTRAALLGRWSEASAVAPRLPVTNTAAFLKNPNEATAAELLLQLPGARPIPSWGYGRNLPLQSVDEFGRNWWQRPTPESITKRDLPYLSEIRLPRFDDPGPLPFLSPAQTREAEQEWRILQQTGAFGFYGIAKRVVATVRANPARPDAPELLYRVLDASRRGWWGVLPDDSPDYTSLQSAARLLSTRYRHTKWFREAQKFQSWETPVPLAIP